MGTVGPTGGSPRLVFTSFLSSFSGQGELQPAPDWTSVLIPEGPSRTCEVGLTSSGPQILLLLSLLFCEANVPWT